LWYLEALAMVTNAGPFRKPSMSSCGGRQRRVVDDEQTGFLDQNPEDDDNDDDADSEWNNP